MHEDESDELDDVRAFDVEFEFDVLIELLFICGCNNAVHAAIEWSKDVELDCAAAWIIEFIVVDIGSVTCHDRLARLFILWIIVHLLL